MTLTETLTASLEDYLEAIFHIIAEKQAVRPKDIAKRLKVSNSSVTGALRSLADKQFINYAPYDVISLTTTGKRAAKDVIRRHETLRDFFVKVLFIDEAEADKAACDMEHSIPKVVLERFIQFAEFIDTCPRSGPSWVAGFGYHCDAGIERGRCERCVTAALDDLHQLNTEGAPHTMTTATLSDLRPGQKGKVLKVKAGGETTKRIVEMGVTPGALIEIERVAPLGDPIEVKVRGYHLSLRKEEARDIEIEAL